MRFRKGSRGDHAESPFWITYSDLLSSLVMVFLVFLLAFQALTAQQLENARISKEDAERLARKAKEEAEKARAAEDRLKIALAEAEKYKKMAQDLKLDEDADALEHLRNELEGLKGKLPFVEIDRKTGEVKISDKILFDSGKDQLSPKGEAVLMQVLPTWSAIVTRPEYSGIIKEVIFEGHADAQGPADRNENYVSNLDLTLKRSEAVARFVFSPKWNFDRRKELRELVSSSGRSNVVAVTKRTLELKKSFPNDDDEQIWTRVHEKGSSEDRRVALRLTFKNPLLLWQPRGGAVK